MNEIIQYIESNAGKNSDGRYFDYFKKNDYKCSFVELSGSKLPSVKDIAKKGITPPTIIKLGSGNKTTYHMYGEVAKGQMGLTQIDGNFLAGYSRGFTKNIPGEKKELKGPLINEIKSKNAHHYEDFWEKPQANRQMENAKALSNNLIKVSIPFSAENTQEIINGILKLHQDLLTNPKFFAAVDAMLKKRNIDPDGLDMDPGHKPIRTNWQFAVDNLLHSYALTVTQGVYRAEMDKDPIKMRDAHATIASIAKQCTSTPTVKIDELDLKDPQKLKEKHEDLKNMAKKIRDKPPTLDDAQKLNDTQKIHGKNIAPYIPKLINALVASNLSDQLLNTIKAVANNYQFNLIQKETLFSAIKEALNKPENAHFKNPDFLKICDNLVKDQKAFNALNANEKALFNEIHSQLKGFAAQKTATSSQTQTQSQTQVNQSKPTIGRQRSEAISTPKAIDPAATNAKPTTTTPTASQPVQPQDTTGRQRREVVTKKPVDLDVSLKAQEALENITKEWKQLEKLEMNTQNLSKFYAFMNKISPFNLPVEFENNKSFQNGVDNIVSQVNKKLQAGIESLRAPEKSNKPAEEKQVSAQQNTSISIQASESSETASKLKESASSVVMKKR